MPSSAANRGVPFLMPGYSSDETSVLNTDSCTSLSRQVLLAFSSHEAFSLAENKDRAPHKDALPWRLGGRGPAACRGARASYRGKVIFFHALISRFFSSTFVARICSSCFIKKMPQAVRPPRKLQSSGYVASNMCTRPIEDEAMCEQAAIAWEGNWKGTVPIGSQGSFPSGCSFNEVTLHISWNPRLPNFCGDGVYCLCNDATRENAELCSTGTTGRAPTRSRSSAGR